MSRISKDKSDKSTITSNKIMSCYASNYKKDVTVTFFSEGVIQVDDNSSLCEGLTKSEPSTIEYLENLEKENANLKKLIYKCKSLMYARSSFEAYEIWEEVEEQLKEQGDE